MLLREEKKAANSRMIHHVQEVWLAPVRSRSDAPPLMPIFSYESPSMLPVFRGRLISLVRLRVRCYSSLHSVDQFDMAGNVQLKVPKGTRDWFGADVILREHIL